MKALIQRVTHAELSVNGALVSSVQRGYLVFLGVQKGDTREQAEYLAAKTAKLRIFEDENGKINRSVLEEKRSPFLSLHCWRTPRTATGRIFWKRKFPLWRSRSTTVTASRSAHAVFP